MFTLQYFLKIKTKRKTNLLIKYILNSFAGEYIYVSMERVVALVDMDCFYVQVEQRLKPETKGLPCAVVQYKKWRGGGYDIQNNDNLIKIRSFMLSYQIQDREGSNINQIAFNRLLVPNHLNLTMNEVVGYS